jgi:hypothetical protein
MRLAVIALLGLSLGGCAVPLPKTTKFEPREIPHLEAHEVTDNTDWRKGQSEDSPTFLSCTTAHDYLVSDSAQAVITAAWPFALMASNSYRTNPRFVIPGWSLKHHFRGDLNSGYGVGFQADVYVRSKDGKPPTELAVVFRGTDHSVDWRTNLSLWWPWNDERAPAQFIQAKEVVRQLAEKERYRGLPINLVGHSLGGGMAFHVGWTRPNTKVFAFNTSPRVWASGDAIQIDRFDIAETGEVLRAIQFWRTLPGEKARMNFRTAGAFSDHNMYYFARAVLYQARRQDIPNLARGQKDDGPANASKINLGCSVPYPEPRG